MARSLALLTAVAALGACATSTVSTASGATRSGTAAGAVAGGPACGPSSARSLAVSARSRIYVVGGRTVYGCTRGSAARRLGVTGPCQRPGAVGDVAVAGRDAAVVIRDCGVDTGSSTVEVLRLTDGHVLSSHPAATVSAPESFTSVSGLVLADDGTVAWIGQASSIVRHSTATGVYAAAPRRAATVRTLDPGPGVAGGSLRLSARTVSWRHGAARRRAQL